MIERQRHRDAFELYFKNRQNGCSISQAISLVSIELKFSETSLYKWKDEFNWDDKEAVRSAEIQKQVEKKTNSSIIDNKVKYLSIAHNPLDQYVRDIKDGKRKAVDIKSPRDIDILIKLGLLIQGEATEKTEQEHKGSVDVNVIDKIKEYRELTKPDK